MRNIRNSTQNTQRRPVTSQRRLLLDLIHQASGHIDAKELYRCAINQDKSISLATVYRNLRYFKELGIIDDRHLGELRCYYEVKQDGEHQHLMCQGCGKIIEFDNPLLRELLEIVQRENNFKVIKVELFLQGYCSNCDGKGEENTGT